MRKVLLAGITTAVVGGLATTAFAQSPVFNMTTRPGKLDGAAPGSVQVNIGGTLFAGIFFYGGTGNTGPAQKQNPNLVDYIRLYPNFDYANPSGVHFGVSAEIRSAGAAQDESRSTNTLYWHSATGYVSSEKFGKFEVGTPNDAIDQLGVGSGDDYGTGGFYSEYGFPTETNFIASDSYDGDNPKQKLAYISPSFQGFTFAVSYQPTSVGLNNSSGLTEQSPVTAASTATPGGIAASKDRVEVAVQFSRAFGPASVKADVGYATATAAPSVGATTQFHDVSYFQGGAVVNAFGFELEGQVNTGTFSAAGNDSGNWGGPLAKGSKDTTAWIVGVGYNMGPYSIGAQYYRLTNDAGDVGFGKTGTTETGQGEALGAGYQVGPGVSVYFDAITDNNKAPGVKTTYGTGVGLGTYFSW
jgi:hypothetical protein